MQDERPITTVDVALFVLREAGLCVLLTRRAADPFAGAWALPGGFVHVTADADLEATARRVLREKTQAEVAYLEQLATFSGAERDPRGWSISVAYYALVPTEALGELDAQSRLCPVGDLVELPFDHGRIVEAAVARLRDKSSYSSLPTYLLPSSFTLADLQKVYEQVIGEPLERTTFRRNILAQHVVVPLAGAARRGAHRPAQLYRRASDQLKAFDRTL